MELSLHLLFVKEKNLLSLRFCKDVAKILTITLHNVTFVRFTGYILKFRIEENVH